MAPKLNPIRTFPISRIIVREELQPRNQTHWQHVYEYRKKMEAGEEFPPVCVGMDLKDPVLIDGRQRIDARKALKERYVKAEVLPVKPADFFVEAVRRNTCHGHGLSVQEMVRAGVRLLTEEKRPEALVAAALRVPVPTLRTWMKENVVWVKTNGDRTAVVPKKPMRRWAARGLATLTTEAEQKSFVGVGERNLVQQVIDMLRVGAFDPANAQDVQLLKALGAAVAEFLGGVRAGDVRERVERAA